MYQTQIREKAAEAAAIATKFREEPTDELTRQVTDINVQLHELTKKQKDYEAGEEAARRILDADRANFVRNKNAPEGPPKPSKDELKAVRHEITKAFFRRDDKAALAIAAEHQDVPEIATMIASDGSQGGTLVAPEWGEIDEGRSAPVIMRELCDVQTTTSDLLVVPRITSELTANAWSNEGEEPSTRQDISTGGVEIAIHDWHPDPVVVSQKLIRNPGAQIEQIIMNRIMRRKGLDEDNAFLTGTGVGRPMGIMNESITTVNSLDGSTLTWAGMINLIYTLPEQWAANATMIMRRLTYAALLGTTDPGGTYVFQVAAASAPNTVLGIPVRFTDFIPAIAASAVPIIIGDFSAYTIAENPGAMTVKRLDEAYDPNVGFSTIALLGGRAIDLDAFRTQTISA